MSAETDCATTPAWHRWNWPSLACSGCELGQCSPQRSRIWLQSRCGIKGCARFLRLLLARLDAGQVDGSLFVTRQALKDGAITVCRCGIAACAQVKPGLSAHESGGTPRADAPSMRPIHVQHRLSATLSWRRRNGRSAALRVRHPRQGLEPCLRSRRGGASDTTRLSRRTAAIHSSCCRRNGLTMAPATKTVLGAAGSTATAGAGVGECTA